MPAVICDITGNGPIADSQNAGAQETRPVASEQNASGVQVETIPDPSPGVPYLFRVTFEDSEPITVSRTHAEEPAPSGDTTDPSQSPQTSPLSPTVQPNISQTTPPAAPAGVPNVSEIPVSEVPPAGPRLSQFEEVPLASFPEDWEAQEPNELSSEESPLVEKSPHGPRAKRNPTEVPVLRDREERRRSIVENTPAIFPIDDNPDAEPYPDPIYARTNMEEVTENNERIEKAARRNNIDPDLLRAIIWIESTHGWTDRIKSKPGSIRPGNVGVEQWKELGITREDLADPSINIEAAAYIVAQIADRLQDPTPEKIASLYNSLAKEQVTGYGKTVAYYYETKPWAKSGTD